MRRSRARIAFSGSFYLKPGRYFWEAGREYDPLHRPFWPVFWPDARAHDLDYRDDPPHFRGDVYWMLFFALAAPDHGTKPRNISGCESIRGKYEKWSDNAHSGSAIKWPPTGSITWTTRRKSGSIHAALAPKGEWQGPVSVSSKKKKAGPCNPHFAPPF